MTTAYDHRRATYYVSVRERENGDWSYRVSQYDLNLAATPWESTDAKGAPMHTADAALAAGLAARDEIAWDELDEQGRREHARTQERQVA